MKHIKRVLNKLKCKELVSNTLQFHIIRVRVIDGNNAACGSDIPVLCQDGSRSQISHQGFGLAEIPVARLASAHYL